MKKAFCLLNHTLTEKQIAELKSVYEAEKIEYPLPEIAEQWTQIPPKTELRRSDLQNIIEWLFNAAKGDVLIVQGEAGSAFAIADWALQRKIVPLYAVTKRVESEERQGEKVFRHYVFEHICFRKYSYFSDLE